MIKINLVLTNELGRSITVSYNSFTGMCLYNLEIMMQITVNYNTILMLLRKILLNVFTYFIKRKSLKVCSLSFEKVTLFPCYRVIWNEMSFNNTAECFWGKFWRNFNNCFCPTFPFSHSYGGQLLN